MIAKLLGSFSLVLATQVTTNNLTFNDATEPVVYKRTNCQVDASNPIIDTCSCDVTANGSVTGTITVSCNDLACEEFDLNSVPASCTPGMRGVTCWLTNTYFLGMSCPLMNPRVDPQDDDASAFCARATTDLQKKGYASRYYRMLERTYCTPAGYSYPPETGWEYTGSFKEGWN